MHEEDYMEFQHLSIRFWSSPGDDVCLILCEPTPEEIVTILESLASLCPADVPSDLASLALTSLQKQPPQEVEYHLICKEEDKEPKDIVEAKSHILIASDGITGCGARQESVMAFADVNADIIKEERQTEDGDSLQESRDKTLPVRRGKRFKHPSKTKEKNPKACRGDEDPLKVKVKGKPGRKKKEKVVPDPQILPDRELENPEKQAMLDRLAVRRKLMEKGHFASCSSCGVGNMTEYSLRVHLMREHQFKPCKACLRLFPDSETAQAHLCQLRDIACDQCPRRFTSLDGWTVHRQNVHEGVRHVCHMCGQQLAYRSALRRHLETQHGILPGPVGARGIKKAPGVAVPSSHMCDKCGKSYKDRISIRNHILLVHGGVRGKGDGPVHCELCAHVSATKYANSKHLYAVHRDKTKNKKEKKIIEVEEINEQLKEELDVIKKCDSASASLID